jgi:hypothetical protein
VSPISFLFTTTIAMSNNAEIEAIDNSNECINGIEEAIAKDYFKHYEYKHFSYIKEIGSGGFARVYRANCKNSDQYLALKTFFKLDNATIQEIVHEVTMKYNIYLGLYHFLLKHNFLL